MGVGVRFVALAVVALPVVVSCGSEADPAALVAQECADLVTSEPDDTETSAGTLPELISWMERPVALTGEVDAVQRTVTVTDLIAIGTDPDSVAVGTTLPFDRFSLCQVPEIAQLDEVTVLGVLGTEQDLSVIAVVDVDQRLTPTTWQQSYDDARALLGTVDRRSSLQALIEHSVDDPTFAVPPEPDPYDAWLALPADQRQLDPAATPLRVLDEFGVTTVTIGFDMPPELRDAAGQGASAESFVRLSAPELAAITTVATSISDAFVGPSLIPAEGPLVVDIMSATGEVLAGPFDVSELRTIRTDHEASPTIRVRTDEQSGWEVAVVAEPLQ